MNLRKQLKTLKAALFKKKHNFGSGTMFPLATCRHCGDTTGLDNWQLRDMPVDMAECQKGQRMGLFELLSESVNCIPRQH